MAFPTVFGAMVTVHVLIGIGEGIITALAVRSVLAVRPDLVEGARGIELDTRRQVTVGIRRLQRVPPDGLERVAEDTEFASTAEEHPLADLPFSDYATDGIDNDTVSLAVAGAAGTAVTLLVTFGLAGAVRAGRRDDDDLIVVDDGAASGTRPTD